MNKYITSIYISLLFLFTGCEKVVEVELEESAPRLVVEASLIWDMESHALPLSIKLSETVPYFADQISPVSGAVVNVTSELGDTYVFEETEPGVFTHEGFVPQLNTSYFLQVIYQGEIFEATEKIATVPALDFVEQTDEGGFSGEDTEFRIFYQDPKGTNNYYLFKFFYQDKMSLQIYDDEFTDGNQTFAFFGEEDIAQGDEVIFEVQGISRKFYEYMYLLRSQAGTSGGPFQSAPTIVKGNIINSTNPDNYAFGFFRLSFRDSLSYQVK